MRQFSEDSEQHGIFCSMYGRHHTWKLTSCEQRKCEVSTSQQGKGDITDNENSQ